MAKPEVLNSLGWPGRLAPVIAGGVRRWAAYGRLSVYLQFGRNSSDWFFPLFFPAKGLVILVRPTLWGIVKLSLFYPFGYAKATLMY